MKAARLRKDIHAFLRDERGEVGAGTYVLSLIIALWLIFFALDVGIRKATRLNVEYAAYCAARAAAVHFQNNSTRTCDATEANTAAKAAAAACMTASVGKHGVSDPSASGAISTLINRAANQLTVTLSGGCPDKSNVVTAVVQYTHTIRVPLSPLSAGSTATVMTASAQHVTY